MVTTIEEFGLYKDGFRKLKEIDPKKPTLLVCEMKSDFENRHF